MREAERAGGARRERNTPLKAQRPKRREPPNTSANGVVEAERQLRAWVPARAVQAFRARQIRVGAVADVKEVLVFAVGVAGVGEQDAADADGFKDWKLELDIGDELLGAAGAEFHQRRRRIEGRTDARHRRDAAQEVAADRVESAHVVVLKDELIARIDHAEVDVGLEHDAAQLGDDEAAVEVAASRRAVTHEGVRAAIALQTAHARTQGQVTQAGALQRVLQRRFEAGHGARAQQRVREFDAALQVPTRRRKQPVVAHVPDRREPRRRRPAGQVLLQAEQAHVKLGVGDFDALEIARQKHLQVFEVRDVGRKAGGDVGAPLACGVVDAGQAAEKGADGVAEGEVATGRVAAEVEEKAARVEQRQRQRQRLLSDRDEVRIDEAEVEDAAEVRDLCRT